MICIYHNRDMDGYASGAIVKLKYPEAKLIGWDYAEEMPDFKQFYGEDVIMIDITFPIGKIKNLLEVVNHLTIIDHHIGIFKDIVKEFSITDSESAQKLEHIAPKFRYVYQLGRAACEIGWEYFFPDKPIPYGITLLGRYDTWRKNEGNWEEETLPFQMFMRLQCNSAKNFPEWLFIEDSLNVYNIGDGVRTGKKILEYQRMENAKYAKGAFERDFGGLRAICLNTNLFSSQVFDTVYDEAKHDVMIPFCYQHGQWKCSIYSTKDEIDCSQLAKARGGGGHKGAAGFEVKNFEDIFK